jgi:hypothetical protein
MARPLTFPSQSIQLGPTAGLAPDDRQLPGRAAGNIRGSCRAPYSSHRPTEIVSAPKVYGFDTGFVCYHRGITSLRPEDMSLLWEHIVLNEIQGSLQHRTLHYWRNKRGAEIDFVLPLRGRHEPIALECKWQAASFDPAALLAFRRVYRQGESYVVAPDVERAYTRTYTGTRVSFLSLDEFIARLAREPLALGPHARHEDTDS